MENKEIDKLNEIEIRVLGALIEKSKSTPEYYPLTLNSLLNACNQKSSRNLVMNLEDAQIIEALDSLKKRQLIAHVIGGHGSRALKYRHTISVKYSIDPAELAIICLLFLRGPLTAGEINSNSSRLYEFDSLNEVQTTIQQLLENNPQFVNVLEKRVGQKEVRYYHCFTDNVPQNTNTITNENINQSDKISELENKINVLEIKLDRLYKELGIEL